MCLPGDAWGSGGATSLIPPSLLSTCRTRAKSTASDVMACAAGLGVKVDAEEVKRWIAPHDVAGDGELSPSEFKAMMAGPWPMPSSAPGKQSPHYVNRSAAPAWVPGVLGA